MFDEYQALSNFVFASLPLSERHRDELVMIALQRFPRNQLFAQINGPRVAT